MIAEMTIVKERRRQMPRGKGNAVTWLRDHVAFAGGECLIYPFARNPETGYGMLGFEGGHYYAHRFMCELVHGPSPIPKQYAVHSCGRGHDGCVNPRHLAWDTSAGNAADRVFHGNQKKAGEPRYKLTQELADQIRALKGKQSQYDIARDFNISRENVARIHRGVAWTGKPMNHGTKLTDDERAIAALRCRQLHKEGKTYDEIAAEFGITRSYASMLARGKFRTASSVSSLTKDPTP